MKSCSKCGESFPKEHYKIASRKQGYRRSECRTCMNKDKSIRAMKYYTEWMTKLIPQHLGMEKIRCLRCGYDRSLVAIEFHHSDPEKKEQMISALVRNISPFGENKHKVLEEVDKCEIICSNCHREILLGGK